MIKMDDDFYEPELNCTWRYRKVAREHTLRSEDEAKKSSKLINPKLTSKRGKK